MEQKVTAKVVEDIQDEPAKEEIWCLQRVGRTSDWLRLFDNAEVTIGRGFNVTHQLLSCSCPLMISRLHCVFKQKEDGQWTVTDKKSLNGVWVNGRRLFPEEACPLNPQDSIKLGVPLSGTKVEYEYVLGRHCLKEVTAFLAKGPSDRVAAACKRKLRANEAEPSAESKSKLYRHLTADKSQARACPTEEAERETPDTAGPSSPWPRPEALPEGSGQDLAGLQKYALTLWEHVDDTQRRLSALEQEQQVEVLRGQLQRVERLENSIRETKKHLEVGRTQQQEEGLRKQLEEALQEHRKVIEELKVSRQGFEEVLLAKDKELQATKEEKEEARAQKDQVVTQMTEVLENELQCIICSELFIKAVTLNCAHSFCHHCIQEWLKRKRECPICRQVVQSQTPSLVLDNCIDRMVDNLSPGMKQRRLELIDQRKGQPAQVVVLQDDDSSSDLSMDSFESLMFFRDSSTSWESFSSSFFSDSSSSSFEDDNDF